MRFNAAEKEVGLDLVECPRGVQVSSSGKHINAFAVDLVLTFLPQTSTHAICPFRVAENMSPSGQLHLLFVRHGETQDNIDRVLQGHRDTNLTEKGVGESKVLAKNLDGQQIDVIYHSPLKRITQTMEPILKNRQVKEIYSDANLKGQGLGDLEGLRYDKVDFGNPRDADVQPGVEKFDDFVQRLKDVTGKIIAAEAPKVSDRTRVVMVASHGVCITSMFKVLEDTAPCDGFAPPVAVRGPDAYEVRWTDSDDVAKIVVADPSKLPVSNEKLQWDRIGGKPFLVSSLFTLLLIFSNGVLCVVDRGLGKEGKGSLKISRRDGDLHRDWRMLEQLRC